MDTDLQGYNASWESGKIKNALKKLVLPVLFLCLDWLRHFHRKGSLLGFVLMGAVILYLGAIFVVSLSCQAGVFACTMAGFNVIFPFYVLSAFFMHALNIFWFIVFFAMSALSYSYCAYYIGSLLDGFFMDRGSQVLISADRELEKSLLQKPNLEV